MAVEMEGVSYTASPLLDRRECCAAIRHHVTWVPDWLVRIDRVQKQKNRAHRSNARCNRGNRRRIGNPCPIGHRGKHLVGTARRGIKARADILCMILITKGIDESLEKGVTRVLY